MNYYIKAIKQYADFKGRARRAEFWYFTLFNMIFGILAIILDNLSGLTIPGEIYGMIYFIYVLATFIPSLALTIRRLHDVGKSGWFYLIGFIPLIGAIWLFILFLREGEAGVNKWGVNPKQ